MKTLVFLIVTLGFGFAVANGNVGYAGEAALGADLPSFGMEPFPGLDYAAFDCRSVFPDQWLCLNYAPGIAQLYVALTYQPGQGL